MAKPGAALSSVECVARHRVVPSLNRPVRDTRQAACPDARPAASSGFAPRMRSLRGNRWVVSVQCERWSTGTHEGFGIS